MDKYEVAAQIRRDYMREYLREWRKKNPEKVREHQQNYWVRKAEKMLAEKENEERAH